MKPGELPRLLRIPWKGARAGVDVTTAMFSVVNGVLLRPLPYPAADRLVYLGDLQRGTDVTPLSYPEYIDWKTNGAAMFDEVGAWFPSTLTLTGVGDAVTLNG